MGIKQTTRYALGFMLGLQIVCGQATEGSIVGTITDASGAAAPNAKITITSAQTAATRSTVTDSQGEYVVTNLPLGFYTVMADKPGFKRISQPSVEISVKARVRVDLTMTVGEASQSVEVVGNAAQLRTDSAEVSGVVTSHTLDTLPLLSRNFLSAAALVPGTTGGPKTDRRREMSGESLTVSGGGSDNNNYIIDGISNNMEFNGTLGVVPAIDSIQEFAVQTSQYSAEFGRSGGGVVNVAIKSGTNQLHGFAYDYFRNDKLDARPYDFTGTNPAKQPLRRNQFGFGAGGPIVHNRLFLFGNFEGIRAPNNTLTQQVVPTALEKRGDFSRSGYVVADPATQRVDPTAPTRQIRTPFPGNVIPSGRFNPITVKLLSVFPDPNYTDPNPKVLNNYQTVEKNQDRSDSINLKSDYHATATQTLTGRYSTQLADRSRSSWLPDNLAGATAVLDGTNAGITYTKVIGSNIVHEARIGYNYTNYSQFLLNSNNVLDQFHIPGIGSNEAANGFPTLSMRSIKSTTAVRPIASSPVPLLKLERSFQFMDNWSVQKRRHSLKVGAEFTRVRSERNQGLPGNASFTFDGNATTPTAGQALETLRTGVADALLGLAQNYTTQYVVDLIRMRQSRFAWFVQDYWRVSRKLTLSIGLRHDLVTPYGELRDRLTNFDFATGQRLLVASTKSEIANLGIPGGNLPSTFRYTDRDAVVPHMNFKDFGPRFGFSYAPNHRTVLRGGYGLFYGISVGNFASNQGVVPPFLTTLPLVGELTAPLRIDAGFPAGGAYSTLTPASLGVNYMPLDLPTPYTEKYNLDIQFNPVGRLFLDAGFTGQRALHSMATVQRNAPLPGPGVIQARRQFPLVGPCACLEPVSDSNANALEISAKVNYWKHLTLQSAFTFSKVLNYVDGNGTGTTVDPYNLRYDYGRAGYDFRRRWVSAVNYDIPTPARLPRPLKWLVANWSTSAFINLQGGYPFTVLVSGQVLNNGLANNRADLIRNPNLPVGSRTRDRWFDTGAFAVPAIYQWGAQGKNVLSGPGLARFDFGLQKAIPVGEGKKLFFRMESSNLFNRVNLDLPAATLGGLNFGAIRGIADGPRNIQLVGRFTF